MLHDRPRSPLIGGGLALLALLATGAAAQVATPAPETAGLGLLDAVALALRNDPAIRISETRVDGARGALSVARARFEPIVAGDLFYRDLETPLDETASSSAQIVDTTVALDYPLRSSLVLSPSVDLGRVDSGAAVNTATVAFTLRQPLLRGRGRARATSEERAAEGEVEASRLDLAHRVAQRLLAVVSQYWEVRAAARDLEILIATERSSRTQLEQTRKLVEADLRPASDLVQLEADLLSREANRLVSERLLVAAIQGLGREIGLEPPAIAALALPADPFPRAERAALAGTRALETLLATAFDRRADLRAARARSAVAGIRLRAADHDLAPVLDLVLEPAYTGLVEGAEPGDYFSPLLRNVPGVSATFGLSLTLPTWNRRAEGLLALSRADAERSALEVELLSREIGAAVPTALDAVLRNAEALDRLERAVELFDLALENEQKKLQAGTSTLIDVLTQRDRLTSARQRQVAARRALAVSLVELRFATGTLFTTAGDRFSDGTATVDYDDLTTPPL